MKNYIIGVLAVFAIIGYFRTHDHTTTIAEEVPPAVKTFSQTQNLSVTRKREPKATTVSTQTSFRSGQQTRGTGTVIRVLSDDTKGSRHQKFIIRVPTGRTLLVAHNIDLAPRLNGLRVGDHVEFYGVYEHNSKGGVIHWTHHDPSNRHTSGWLKLNGRTYQ